MKIAIGSDHAGFKAKEELAKVLSEEYDVTDCGTTNEESVDYPDFAAVAAKLVASKNVDYGILMCGTGIGMCMAANKIHGVRAAVCHDADTARLSRRHNDANVLCMGSRILSIEQIINIAKVWLGTDFEGGRHSERVKKIMSLED